VFAGDFSGTLALRSEYCGISPSRIGTCCFQAGDVLHMMTVDL
jgi:hypothetical protein